MSIIGRRGSSESGWTWPRLPSGPRRPPPTLPLLPFAGLGLVLLMVVIAVLVVWLSDDEGAPAGASGTPTRTATVTATPSPALTPTPTPTSVASDRTPLFRLAAWDGEAWQFNPPLEGATYREGEAVPFLLSIDRARPGDVYFVTLIYECEPFAFLTSYDRDTGGAPAAAQGGPGSAVPDTTLPVPDDSGTPADDAEGGSLSLWGGSFRGLTSILPISACAGEKSFTVGLAAATDTVSLLWGGRLSPRAAERPVPLRMAVLASVAVELSFEIAPTSVTPARP